MYRCMYRCWCDHCGVGLSAQWIHVRAYIALKQTNGGTNGKVCVCAGVWCVGEVGQACMCVGGGGGAERLAVCGRGRM